MIADSVAGYDLAFTESNVAPVGVWIHVVATIDNASFMQIWVNGVVLGTTDTLARTSNTGTFQLMGAVKTSATANGLIDDVMIYNRALTQDIYNAQKP